MCRFRISLLLLALSLLLAPLTALAAETDCDAVYCFTSDDFQQPDAAPLQGVCITGLPDPATGTVLLGHRVVQKGDILTASQLSTLTFTPLRTEVNTAAEISYLPIYENRVAPTVTVTVSIRGKEDKAPVAQDASLETYKNLPLKGKLSVADPEGERLTLSILRKPKRGQVELAADGSFVYTPKKNKVGIDSFTYTATDPAGNVSRTATITVQILKPSDSRQYADTKNTDCRFSAEWMRHTGLFTGESVSGQLCFGPEKNVSRGEFLAMLVKALELPTKDSAYDTLPANTPVWLQPYLAAALRAGLTAGWKDTDTFTQTVTGAEVAMTLQNALDLHVSGDMIRDTETGGKSDDPVPTWAEISVAALAENGISLTPTKAMTRADIAQILYKVCHLQTV